MARWWLTRIHIERFRRLQEPLTVSLVDTLDRPLDTLVVAGSNGAGKTSFLEAILFGLGQERLIVRGVPEGEQRSFMRHRFPTDAIVDLTFSLDGAPGETLRYARDAGRFRVRREGPDGAREEIDLHDLADLPAHLAALPDELQIEEPRYFSSWRAPALVGALAPSIGGSVEPTEANRVAALKQRIINLAARSAFGRSSTAVDVLLARLNKAWSYFHVTDGTHIAPDVVDPDDEKTALFDLYVLNRDGSRRCAIDDVSAGELELIAMAGELMVDDKPRLVLVDEPELHLHPEWVSQIKRALRSFAPGAQFILSTHADAPWDQASSYERLLLGPLDDPRVALQYRDVTRR